MRFVWLPITLALFLLVANSAALAQRSGAYYGQADCGCDDSAVAACDCGTCDVCAPACGLCLPPVLPALAKGVHCLMDTLFPCCGVRSTQERCGRAAVMRSGARSRCWPVFPLISYRGCVETAEPCCSGSTPTYAEEFETQLGPGEPLPPAVQPRPAEPEPAMQEQSRRSSHPGFRRQVACRTCSQPARLSGSSRPTARPVSHTQSTPSPQRRAAGNVPARFQPSSVKRIPRHQPTRQAATTPASHEQRIPQNPLR